VPVSCRYKGSKQSFSCVHAVVYREVELWNSFSEKMARMFRPRTSPMYQQVANRKPCVKLS